MTTLGVDRHGRLAAPHYRCQPYHCAVSNRPLPRIGLSTYRETAAWGVWNEPADLLPTNYAEGIRAAGGVALLLPPADPTAASDVLDGLDGLLLAGGADVDPDRYDAERHVATGASRPDRDGWELALAGAALERNLPVLAVCRGMQVLNVALGGTLRQHLPEDVGTDLHCPVVGEHGRHDVTTAPGSAVAAMFGEHTVVATYHHQSVDRLGVDLVATGWAADGVVEAMELSGRDWVLGVQWHPEVFAGAPLFEALVAAARSHRVAGPR
jgi:putative glutamine amidotransferase